MVTTYPVLKIAGVNLNDPSGRWDVLPGTTLLPNFPGRVETRIPTPGVPGYRATAYAPGESARASIVMRFNAVQTYANTIVPGGGADRTQAISQNIDTFFYATALARQGYAGLVELSRELKPEEVRVAHARVVASSEPSFSMGNDYATMTLVFEIPSGVWLDEKYKVFTIPTFNTSGKDTVAKIPAGTAPMEDIMIAFRGSYNHNSDENGISFLNEIGIGFKPGFNGTELNVPTSRYMIIDCKTWRVGISASLNWDMDKSRSILLPIGRPLGNALTLLPSRVAGQAELRVRGVGVASRPILVRSRRAWY